MANRVKVIFLIAKRIIIINFFKKMDVNFFFFYLSILQINNSVSSEKNSYIFFWSFIKPFDKDKYEVIAMYLFLTELIADSSPKFGKFVEPDPI